MNKYKIILIIIFGGLLTIFFACSKKSSSGDGMVNPPPPPAGTNDVDFWLTKGDQSVLLQKQSTVLSFGTTTNTKSKYRCGYNTNVSDY